MRSPAVEPGRFQPGGLPTPFVIQNADEQKVTQDSTA
jgi:hypothetical protein